MMRVSTSSTPAINLNIPTFTGLSQFASTYQQILTRLSRRLKSRLRSCKHRIRQSWHRKQRSGPVNSAVAALSTSLTSLATVAANGGSGGHQFRSLFRELCRLPAPPHPATYTINSITSAATTASQTSINPVADATSTPVSGTGYMELDVGAQKFDFTLTNNTLTGLRESNQLPRARESRHRS